MSTDGPFRSQRLSRRLALQLGAGASAVAGMVGVIGPRAAAAPATQNGVVTIKFQANNQGAPWNSTTVSLVQNFVDSTFNKQNKGIRAMVDPGGWGGVSGQLASALAGGPTDDIIASCCNDFAGLFENNMAVPLDPYMKRDNISPSLFAPAHMAVLNVAGQQLGLPSYDGPAVVIYRQDLLDDAGIQYPTSDWTYTEARDIWAKLSGMQSNGQRRFGLYGPSTVMTDDSHWQVWIHAFGGQLMNGARTRCLVNSPQAAKGLQFAIDLYRQNIAYTGNTESCCSLEVGSVQQGLCAFSFCGSWDVYSMATDMGGLKWDILPAPKYPNGRATYGNIDFYAIFAATKHPDEAWEVLKWLTAEPAWQRFDMRTTLVTPGLLSLWDEWQQIAETVAPPLRGKALNWYKDAALGGYGYPTINFRYSPDNVSGIIDNWMPQAVQGKITVQVALQQIESQINALESVGAANNAIASKMDSTYAKEGAQAAAAKGAISLSPPPYSDAGVAPTKAPHLLQTQGTTLVISGAGNGVDGNGASDGCTFAGQAWTKSQGSFTCRLTAIHTAKGQTLPQAAKVGLMARGSLGSGSAEVFLNVAANRGVHLQKRPVDGVGAYDTGQPPVTQATGFFGTQFIMANNGAPAANYMLKPVWLRLTVDGQTWTAWTSLDGKTWTNCASQFIQPIGWWVGLAVTSHNSGQYITATFDNVSGFAPSTVVQIGSA